MKEIQAYRHFGQVVRRAGLCTAPLALLAVMQLPAHAQEDEQAPTRVDDIVVTATRAATPVSELTRSVSVVSEETVEREKPSTAISATFWPTRRRVSARPAKRCRISARPCAGAIF